MSAETKESPAVATNDFDIDWHLELEAALLTNCDFNTVRLIAQNRSFSADLRSQAWMILLGISTKPDAFASWNGVYDLPEQGKIRAECQKIIDKFGNDETDKVAVLSDLESVLTLYCKARNLSFEVGNGWTEILELLLALKLNKSQLYHAFYAITTKYIPRGCEKDGRPFDLFRLLLLYHEPELCSFLDTRKISPDVYATSWFNAMFSHDCALEVSLRMWDVYLQQADPFLMFFLALVILANAKEQIMEMKSAEDRKKLIDSIATFPCQLQADDIEDFCQLSLFFSVKTPQSFRRDYHGPLFGSNLAEAFENVTVHSLLCLPISVQELVQSNLQKRDEGAEEVVRYFVIDTRPPAQYNSGHLPGAYNLDAGLFINTPSEFHTAVQKLISFKAKAHPNEHPCFMGSGREEEDKFLHMVVSSFLQKGIKYVSLARGGYEALHNLLREALSTKLKSHNVKNCIVCNPPRRIPFIGDMETLTQGSTELARKSLSLFDRVSSAVKSKSSEIKGKVVDYIVNPTGEETSKNGDILNAEKVTHVSPSDRHTGKRYRNIPDVFTIGDDSDEQGEEGEEKVDQIPNSRERVKIAPFIQNTDVIAHFDCHDVDDQAFMFPAHLVLTKTHMIIIRDSDDDPNWGFVRVKRSLSTFVKITSKKRIPELLTFKYGVNLEEGETKITGVDRLFIAKAGDAAKAVKSAIVGLQSS